MKKYILWKNTPSLIGGTTLKINSQEERFNMALHSCVSEDAVLRNRQLLCDDMQAELNRCVFAKQTHSDHCVKVTNMDAGKGAFDYESGIEDCDALYTREKNLMIGVFHADCVPVLLYDTYQELICAIHAGWQGTIKEVTAKTIQHLIDHENVDPRNLQVFIGPAICQNNFEVGEDVIEKVQGMSFDTTPFIYYKPETKKAHVDNKGLNLQQCLNKGVDFRNIALDKNCTSANQETFFSYRKDKNCGRHMTFIMMRGE